MNLSPSERMQLTNLLGALQGGLSGSQAYSIFGNIENEITSRRQHQQAVHLAMQKLLYQQQQDAIAQQYQQQQDMIQHKLDLARLQQSAAEQQRLQGEEASAFLNDIYGQVDPHGTTHTTTTTTGTGPTAQTKTSTFTVTPEQVPYSEIMGELQTRGPLVGLSQDQIAAIGKSIDLRSYALPTDQNDQFWTSLNKAVQRGMDAGHDPQLIVDQVTQTAQSQGFGSPDELKAINDAVNRQMRTQGYQQNTLSAPLLGNLGIPEQGGHYGIPGGPLGLTGAIGPGTSGAEGDLTSLGALGHVVAPLLALGSIAAGKKFLYNPAKGKIAPEGYGALLKKGLFPNGTILSKQQPAGGTTPPEAAQSASQIGEATTNMTEGLPFSTLPGQVEGALANVFGSAGDVAGSMGTALGEASNALAGPFGSGYEMSQLDKSLAGKVDPAEIQQILGSLGGTVQETPAQSLGVSAAQTAAPGKTSFKWSRDPEGEYYSPGSDYTIKNVGRGKWQVYQHDAPVSGGTAGSLKEAQTRVQTLADMKNIGSTDVGFGGGSAVSEGNFLDLLRGGGEAALGALGGLAGALGIGSGMSGAGVKNPVNPSDQARWDAMNKTEQQTAAYYAMQGDPRFAWVIPIIEQPS